MRYKNVLSCVLLRPWLGVPFGIWITVSVVYYWWLISRISILETQNKVLQVDSRKLYQVPNIPDATGTLCETIHVALVCMSKCPRLISPMLKSLLHHRQNPIHFHFVVDTVSEHTISHLFETWDLPDVQYTTYNVQSVLHLVSWIPTSHYSGVFALVKLLFADVLPGALPRVLVLDSDLTFASDVAELWALFRNMTEQQFIALVENESNWYQNTETRWPALGRGYNTGVMLLDLHKIRTDTDWTSLWHEAVNENIDRLKTTALADQDVINAIIKKYPMIVYNISCHYNVQMSTETLAKNCYGEDVNNVKVIHWNSPKKYNVNIRDVEYFRSVHLSYVNFDGNLLREKLHRCDRPEAVTVKTTTPSRCQKFRAAQKIKLRTHLYYMDYTYTNVDNFDVTLVLQLSMDRLQFLERLVKHWEGPLSAAIYLSDCEVGVLESFIKDFSDTLSVRKNIGYHLVFKHESVTPGHKVAITARSARGKTHFTARGCHKMLYLPRAVIKKASDRIFIALAFGSGVKYLRSETFFVLPPLTHYPVNYLRNVALENVNTPYVFLMDVDFVPMAGLYSHLRSVIRLVNPYPQKKCLVVPAFETRRYRLSPPRNKTALLARLTARRGADVAPFRALEWPPGHRATNYSRWAEATQPYEVDWENHYEPYIVVHRSVPKYDTRFSGFGWNKVSHSVELRALGYRVVVLPGAFVVHTPHAPSPGITAFRTNKEYRHCLALLKLEFMEDLRRKYNVTLEDSLLHLGKDQPIKTRDKSTE